MSTRKVEKVIRGMAAIDGAGVHLTRVLGHGTTSDCDPFLMLDSFDSRNPADYIQGFPTHPHRGIETFTYLIEGSMSHKDSLGNEGLIKSGGGQWMTAGSGILHAEMPLASERMLGFQLWINLPQADKMCRPVYNDLDVSDIPEFTHEGATIKVPVGQYGPVQGFKAPHNPVTILDISLNPGQTLKLDLPEGDNITLFGILGEMLMDSVRYPEKTALVLGDGKDIEVAASAESAARIIVLSGPRLNEGIAWGGPIVMNTDSELRESFRELRDGGFLKHSPKI